ncbi:hypothetical protein [Domibacillus tundrae]|uniref:hypothetical protein n=1 Tax=Domibacillus tundrae TaxID=1587527 RepID=UPI000A669A06|nr:hypothetical protein [Domibacillus tundrae]
MIIEILVVAKENLLEKGMNIHEVANQAGHASAQTTMLYINARKPIKENNPSAH